MMAPDAPRFGEVVPESNVSEFGPKEARRANPRTGRTVDPPPVESAAVGPTPLVPGSVRWDGHLLDEFKAFVLREKTTQQAIINVLVRRLLDGEDKIDVVAAAKQWDRDRR